MEYNRKAHSVYLLTYHIVFVTKYRKPVITNEIGEFMKNLADICITDLELSKEVRSYYPEEVKKYLWEDAPFGSNSYFVTTTGTTVMEKV